MATKSRSVKLGDYSLPHRFPIRIGYLPSDTSESVDTNISDHFCSSLKVDFLVLLERIRSIIHVCQRI